MYYRAIIYQCKGTIGKQLAGNLTRHASGSTALAFQPKSASVLNPPGNDITELTNGVRVASENTGGDICTVGVWLDQGSRYERPHESGASAILRELQVQPAGALAKDLGKITYLADSYTSREQSAVYLVCRSKDVGTAVDLLSKMAVNPEITKETVETARKTVLRDLQASEDDPREILMHYAHSQAYMKTGLQMPPSGRYSNVQVITADTIANFHKNVTRGSRYVVAATGNVDHNKLVAASEKCFGGMTNNFTDAFPEMTPSRYTGSYMFHREDSWPYPYTMVGVEGPGWDNIDDMITMKVAQKIIGSWQRSAEPYQTSPHRLAHRVGWADHEPMHLYESFYMPYFHTGLWGQYYVSHPEASDRHLLSIQKEWKYLATLASERDVEMGKNFLKMEILNTFENGPSACDELGRNTLRYDRHYSAPQLMSMIDSVDEKRLKETCYEYIYDRCPFIVSFGHCGLLSFKGYWPVRWRTAWWWM